MKPDWRVGELLGTFYRPNFENVLYPYCPPHIARPKEIRRIYMVVLPEKCYFAVPKNYKLVAVPLFEIYDHAQRYGPIIAAIPQLLSRINIVKADAKATGAGGIVPPPVAAPAVEQQQQQGAGALTISLAPNGQNAAAPPPPVVESREEDLTIDFDM